MVIAIAQHRIAYVAVPKSGCTSVKTALAKVDPQRPEGLGRDGDNGFVVRDRYALHKTYQTMRFRAERLEPYEDWFRFTVLRDPLRRLISVYTDIVAGRKLLHNSRLLRREDAVLPKDPDPDFFFQNLRDYVQVASVVKHHALSQRVYTGNRLGLYSRVFRIDQIGELAEELGARVGQPMTIPKLNKSRRALGMDELQPATRDALRDYVAKDYRAFAGLFDRPW